MVEARRISSSMVATPTQRSDPVAIGGVGDIDEAIDAGASMSASCFPQMESPKSS